MQRCGPRDASKDYHKLRHHRHDGPMSVALSRSRPVLSLSSALRTFRTAVKVHERIYSSPLSISKPISQSPIDRPSIGRLVKPACVIVHLDRAGVASVCQIGGFKEKTHLAPVITSLEIEYSILLV